MSSSSSLKGLTMIIGPMYSSKTTSLLSMVGRLTYGDLRVLVIKHSSDVRYTTEEDTIITHNGHVFRPNKHVRIVSSATLAELEPIVDSFDVIAIDEGQFFPDIDSLADRWAMKKHVIVAALDSDYRREPFGAICNMIAKAEVVVKNTGVCMQCKTLTAAAFTKKIGGDLTKLIDVGGTDKYIVCCRACYYDDKS